MGRGEQKKRGNEHVQERLLCLRTYFMIAVIALGIVIALVAYMVP